MWTMRTRSYSGDLICKEMNIKPRILEILEEEGIIAPRRRSGERFYSMEQVEEINFALALRKQMGVNWAGVEVAIEMRRSMKRMSRQIEEVFEYILGEISSKNKE